MWVKTVKYSGEDASEKQKQHDAYGNDDQVCFSPVRFAGIAACAECPDKQHDDID